MQYDKDKVDEMVLALLYLTSSHHPAGTRAWKGFDWESLERLGGKGYLKNPQVKELSVVLSKEGETLSRELFFKHFNARE